MHITTLSLAALDAFQFAPALPLSSVVSLADGWTADDVEHDFDMVDLTAWSQAPD